MPDIRMPDGQVVRFPDDMPDAEIKRMIETKYPAVSKSQPGKVEDIAKSGASGFARGSADLLGAPALPRGIAAVGSQISDFGRSIMPEVMGGLFDLQDRVLGGITQAYDVVPDSGDIRGALSRASNGGTDYQPQTTGGKYAGTVGEFLPGALLFGGANPSNLLRFGAAPGLTSEAAGQATEGTALEPWARVGGALLGPAIPSVAKRAITPLPASPQRTAMANQLRKEGVDLTAGQATGRQNLRYAESELGGGKAADFIERQGEQFTRAALRRAGVNADRATPDILDDAFTQIGNKFDTLAAKTKVPFDAKLQNDMLEAVVDYQSISANTAPAVERIMNRTAELAAKNKGRLEGEAYKNIRSEIGKLISRADGPTQQALRDLQHVIDDAVGRHMPAKFLKDWQTARTQYRNMLVIENSATRAGENAAMGIISPSALRSATVQQSKRAYARGKGDFADLARAGEAILKPLPQSGTAPRQAVRAIGAGIPSILGGGAGAAFGGAPGAMLGATAGVMMPPLMGRALLSAPMRAYLANQMTRSAPILDRRYLGTAATLTGQQ